MDFRDVVTYTADCPGWCVIFGGVTDVNVGNSNRDCLYPRARYGTNRAVLRFVLSDRLLYAYSAQLGVSHWPA